MAKLEDW